MAYAVPQTHFPLSQADSACHTYMAVQCLEISFVAFPTGLEAVKRATYAAENVAPIVLFNPRLAR